MAATGMGGSDERLREMGISIREWMEMTFEQKVALADDEMRRRIELMMLTGLDHHTAQHIADGGEVAIVRKSDFAPVVVRADIKVL